ncbi:MAG: hypothetical protein V2A65_04875 [Candidatus Omnitrophota bacterium]
MAGKTRILTGIVSLFFAMGLYGSEYMVPLKADSGFYLRENELVSAEIDFGRGAENIRLVWLKEDGTKEDVSLYFVPGTGNKGTVYWVAEGIMESLSQREYSLYFSPGTMPETAKGNKEMAARVKALENIIPNPSFEIEEEDIKQTSTEGSIWKGDRKPEDWNMIDYLWADREEPNLKSQCRLIEEEAYEGTKSIKVVSEFRHGKVITGKFFSSSPFPLKPNTRYHLSYYIKITDRQESGQSYQSAQVQVTFLDEKQKSVWSERCPVWRLQTAYSTCRFSKETYLGKWLKVEESATTTDNTRFGEIDQGCGPDRIVGIVYYDNFVLTEIREGEPVKVEVGKIRVMEK